MKISNILLLAGCALCLLLPGKTNAEDANRGVVLTANDVSVRLSGTLQPRVTFASDDDVERVGFGVRRMRVRLSANISDRMGVFLQMEGSGGNATWLDIRGEYYLNNNLTLRTGRFVGTQPRAYARTGHAVIDAIDRPAISDMWARMTIGADGRDYGVEAIWSDVNREFRAFLHNGHNQLNYRQGLSNVPSTGGVKTEGFAFSGSATWWPDQRNGLEVGAYASVNTSQNPLTAIGGVGRNYYSYSANVYWGPQPGDQPFRLKADFIGISYEDVEPFGQENYLGASLFGAVLAAPHIELFAMGEYWYADNGDADSSGRMFGTVGASYSLSALQGRPFALNRIIFTYGLRTLESDSIDFDDAAHVFMMQAQFYF
ncbi:hypothetical protein QLX67_08535 [Balneolaceae bacterium ANBcel3]|nr:hypothetical protein [Balneolaceae bacterium ANBcel3]